MHKWTNDISVNVKPSALKRAEIWEDRLNSSPRIWFYFCMSINGTPCVIDIIYYRYYKYYRYYLWYYIIIIMYKYYYITIINSCYNNLCNNDYNLINYILSIIHINTEYGRSVLHHPDTAPLRGRRYPLIRLWWYSALQS